MTLNTIVITLSSISAASWFLVAIVTPYSVGTFWDGPPKHIVRRQRTGAILNGGWRTLRFWGYVLPSDHAELMREADV